MFFCSSDWTKRFQLIIVHLLLIVNLHKKKKELLEMVSKNIFIVLERLAMLKYPSYFLLNKWHIITSAEA